ncbi:MAG: T9SS type A sorting domain-containing protein [Saprospiraceae bacterium]
MNLKTTFIAFLLVFSSISLSAQCGSIVGTCPSSVTTVQQLTNCVLGGATSISISSDLTIPCDYDLSGISITLTANTDIRFTGNILLSNTTSFPINPASSSLQIGGILFTKNGDPSYADLNAALALIPNGTTISVAALLALLPVEFISFTGKAEKGNAMLHWATATESNNKQFEVEHSLDGKQFKTIEIIPGGGTSFERLDYAFEHKAVSSGLNYYRLRQVDYDGTYAYSDVISIQFSRRKVDVNVFPNPNKGAFTIITESGVAPTQVQLYNMLGQEFQLVSNEAGDYALPQRVQGGTYILKLQIEGATHFERLLIQ